MMLLLAACAVPTDVVSVSASIPAASGGRIELDDHAWVEIPAGALEADAEVTFSRLSCDGIFRSEAFASCGYDLESDAAFVGRYALGLPTRAGDAHLVRQDGSGWRPLIDSEEDGTGLAATSSSAAAFSSQAIEAVGCVDPPFTPCGGDVTGSWQIEMSCVTLAQLGITSSGPDPYAVCAPFEGSTTEFTSLSGSISFEPSGAYSGGESIRSDELDVATEACLEASERSCTAECDLQDGVCTCFRNVFASDGASGGSWEHAPSGLGVLLDGAEVETCVEGDTLMLRWAADPTRVMAYRR